MEENVFEKACLVQISTSVWQGSLQLPQAEMAPLGDEKWLRGRKYLVDPEYLQKIRAVAARARWQIARFCLPFPINGLILVPKDSISQVEEELKAVQELFWTEVETFVAAYDGAREQAKETLGKHFSETDYPQDIRRKFAFEWRYVTMSTPGKNTILTPELYERERKAFLQMIEEARKTAIQTLRGEFSEFVNHLIERMKPDAEGKPKVFKASSLTKFQEFLAVFEDRDLFRDGDLQDLVEKARVITDGLRPEYLRSDDGFRDQVREALEGIAEEVTENFLASAPRRRITLPNAA